MKQPKQSSPGSETERIINSGDRLTIETIADFAQLISQGLKEVGSVVIEFKPDVELDITALQVFCAACKKATAEGKKFIHRGPLPKALSELVQAVGAVRHEPCENDNNFCFCQFEGE